jgi:hypothetical protein
LSVIGTYENTAGSDALSVIGLTAGGVDAELIRQRYGGLKPFAPAPTPDVIGLTAGGVGAGANGFRPS